MFCKWKLKCFEIECARIKCFVNTGTHIVVLLINLWFCWWVPECEIDSIFFLILFSNSILFSKYIKNLLCFFTRDSIRKWFILSPSSRTWRTNKNKCFWLMTNEKLRNLWFISHLNMIDESAVGISYKKRVQNVLDVRYHFTLLLLNRHFLLIKELMVLE